MTLAAFLPILWGLSKQVSSLPWIGEVDHALVWVAIISALRRHSFVSSCWNKITWYRV